MRNIKFASGEFYDFIITRERGGSVVRRGLAVVSGKCAASRPRACRGVMLLWIINTALLIRAQTEYRAIHHFPLITASYLKI